MSEDKHFQNKVGLSVKVLSNRIKTTLNNDFAKNISEDVTGVQGSILGFIRHHSKERDIFQKDIEEAFQIKRSTATGILNSMEKKNLLYRTPVQHDARLKKLVLTDYAITLHDQIIYRIDLLEEQMVKGLSDDEIHVFISVVDRILKNIE